MVVQATVTGYQGLSTDVKPNGSPGQIFVETDTNNIYVWDNATWSQQNLSEVQFLAKQAALGNLVFATAFVSSPASGTSIVAYTPALGKTFTLFKAKLTGNGTTSLNIRAQLRNNATVQEELGCNPDATLSGNTSINNGQYIAKGDQLVGDGSKKYDIFNRDAGASYLAYGVIEGYIA